MFIMIIKMHLKGTNLDRPSYDWVRKTKNISFIFISQGWYDDYLRTDQKIDTIEWLQLFRPIINEQASQ